MGARATSFRLYDLEEDKAVDTAYGQRDFKSEAERVAFLFDLYQKYTASSKDGEKAGKAAAV